MTPTSASPIRTGKQPLYRTDFRDETSTDFMVEPVRINSATPGSRLRHQQAACILRLSTGELLVSCRWDDSGESEGDASNEQALYFSRNDGRSWAMANSGEPIATLHHGTSFDRPSALTQSFIFEDSHSQVWLYYTINQPYTWGEGLPLRSTGGGEIRRILLQRDENGWWAARASEIVWGFRQPIANGRGGTWDDVRALCLNGIIRLRSGRLLMPIAGRSTVADPGGAFWPLDRCWVLESNDDGLSWTESHFIGGGSSLCLCEPTLVETNTDDGLIALMRVQYDTGWELYRSESQDGGHNWTPPTATGLPNTGGSGVKPYLTRLAIGDYALIQTNEHRTTDRTNVSLFLTDDEGLRSDNWPLVKLISAECRSHWLGSMYGWLADAGAGGIDAVWISYTGDESHLNYARLTPAWQRGTVIEPLSPNDSRGDHLPRLGSRGLFFPSVRSRAHAPHLGRLTQLPITIRLRFLVDAMPAAADFHLLDLCSSNGRHPWLTVALRPSHSTTVWVRANTGWLDTGFAFGTELELTLEVLSTAEGRLSLHGRDGTDNLELGLLSRTAEKPTTLYLGGNAAAEDRCSLTLLEAAYGPAHELAK